MNKQCQQLIHRLSRIQGQMNTLKIYLEDEQDCQEIALLSSSISRSFTSFKATLLENMMQKGELDAELIQKLIKN